MDFHTTIRNGKIPEAAAKAIGSCLADLDGKEITLSINPRKRRRSSNQNAYYWGLVVPPIVAMLREAGNDFDDEEVHEYLKTHVGKLRRVVVTPDGEVQRIPGSTRRLTKPEMEVYLERVRAWAARFGVAIPLPNEDVLSTR